MAITFTGIGTGVAASGVGTGAGFSVALTGGCAVGDYFVALIAYDNSGGGGSDPMSGTIGLSPNTMFGASVSAQSGINDPGSASAGLAVRCVVWPVISAFGGGNIGVTWSGTVVVRAVSYMKVSAPTGTVYRTNSGATGTNSAANPAHTTPSINSGEGVLCWAGYEYGAAVTGDADTTNGSWSAVYGAFTGSTTSGMAAYFQSKVVTATATQTWNPTGTTSDWIVGSLIFTENPAITQAAYRVYSEGGEATSTALAAQDTPYTADVSSANVNLQLRTRMQETSGAAVPITTDWTLQFAKNGGAWTEVYSDPKLITTYPFSQWQNWAIVVNATGQSFVGNGEKLSRMAFDLGRTGNPPGTYSAALYAHSGTMGTSSVGTGTPLVTSSTVVNAMDIGTFGWTFFDFDETFTLVNGTNYVMAVTRSTPGDGSNYIGLVYDSLAPTRPGNRCSFDGTTWTANAAHDFMTRVYTKATTPPNTVVGHYSPAMYGSTTSIVESAAVTQRLTNGTGTFFAGGTMSGVPLHEGVELPAGNYMELLFALTLKSTDLANGDTLTFRVVKNGQPLNTYSVTPTLNITKTAVAITQAAYRFYDDAGTESGAAALAAQDTAVNGNITNGDGYGMIRVRLQSTSIASIFASDDFRLQWEKNASGTWNNVVALTTVEDYGWGNETSWDTLGNTNLTSVGQSFTGNGEKLSRVGWSINKSGAPNGTLTATLYAHTGTYGTTGTPTGAVLATSKNSVAATAVPGGGATWMYFDFDETFTLTNATRYFVTLNYTVTGDTSNVLIVDYDGVSPTLSGNKATFTSPTWTATSTQDYLIKLYTKSASATTAVGYDNPNLIEGAATTNRLTGGSGSFVAGKVAEDGHVDNMGWTGNNYTEILYSVRLIAAELIASDTLRFRVLKNAATTDMTYSVTPTVNIVLLPVDLVVQNAQHIFNSGGNFLLPSVARATTPDPGVLPTTGLVFVMKVRGPYGTQSVNPGALASQNRVDGTASWRLTRSTSGNGNGAFSGAAYPTGTFASGLFFLSSSSVTTDLVNPEYLAVTYVQTTQAYTVRRSTDNGVSYSQVRSGFGTAFAGWFDTNEIMTIGSEGADTSSYWDDRIYWVELRTGIDPLAGTVLWRFDAAEHVSGTSWVDARSRTWTLGSASAVSHSLDTDDIVLVQTAPPTVLVVTNSYHNNLAANVTTYAVFQEGFRWRNDDGSQTTATWKAAQDTNVSVSLTGAARLRVVLDTTDFSPATPPYTLYYKKTTDSTWLPVPVASEIYAPAVLTDSPWVYCRLESFGATTPDSSGNGRTVNVRNTYLGLDTGIVGNGLKANPVDSCSFIPQTQIANPPTTYSQELWFRTTRASTAMFRGQLSDPGNVDGAQNNCIWITTSGNIDFRSWDTSGGAYRIAVTSGTDYRDNKWHHVVATESPTNGKRLYVDGSLKATAPYGIDTTFSASYLRFGGTYPGGAAAFLSGAEWSVDFIDECAYYTTELSAARVLAHYNAALVPVYVATSINIASGGEATTALLTPPTSKATPDFVTGRMWDDENGTDYVNLFDPLSLPWTHAWWVDGPEFKALGLSNGAAVATWPDEIGTADMTQATAGNRPLYQTSIARLNNRAGIDPDGIDDFFTFTPNAINFPWSIVVILAPQDAWDNKCITCQPGATTGLFLQIPDGNRSAAIKGSASVYVGYTGNYNARLFAFAAAGTSQFTSQSSVDNGLPNSGTMASYGQISNLPAYAFCYADGVSRFLVDPIAFIGIAAGNIRTDPNWSMFARWAASYYALPNQDTSWTPLYITGLQAWFDASDISSFTFSSDAVVSQWNDKSGWGRNVSQATVANQPNRNIMINGNSAVYFDGNNDVLSPASWALSQPVTIFMVNNWPAYPWMTPLSGTYGSGITVLSYSGPTAGQVYMSAATDVSTGLMYDDSITHTWTFVFNGASSIAYRDGLASGTINPGSLGIVGGLNLGGFGSIGEVIVYNKVLTTLERQQVEAYLKAKWGTP